MPSNSFYLLLLIMLLTAVQAVAEDDDQYPLAIDGYSPVAYFTEGEALRGSAEFVATYNQRRYYFRNAEERAAFKADPRRYEPLFPDHCPYNLALGRAVAIDPTRFKITHGHLLLFHRSDEMDGLEQWNEHEDEAALLERARGNYELFRF